jgi:hypothetical protein
MGIIYLRISAPVSCDSWMLRTYNRRTGGTALVSPLKQDIAWLRRGPDMADSKGLGVVGFILGAISAVVMLVAGAVVHAHVDGRLSLDGADHQIAALSSAVR